MVLSAFVSIGECVSEPFERDIKRRVSIAAACVLSINQFSIEICCGGLFDFDF